MSQVINEAGDSFVDYECKLFAEDGSTIINSTAVRITNEGQLECTMGTAGDSPKYRCIFPACSAVCSGHGRISRRGPRLAVD
jgi:hypothetical protein